MCKNVLWGYFIPPGRGRVEITNGIYVNVELHLHLAKYSSLCALVMTTWAPDPGGQGLGALFIKRVVGGVI